MATNPKHSLHSVCNMLRQSAETPTVPIRGGKYGMDFYRKGYVTAVNRVLALLGPHERAELRRKQHKEARQ